MTVGLLAPRPGLVVVAWGADAAHAFATTFHSATEGRFRHTRAPGPSVRNTEKDRVEKDG